MKTTACFCKLSFQSVYAIVPSSVWSIGMIIAVPVHCPAASTVYPFYIGVVRLYSTSRRRETATIVIGISGGIYFNYLII